VIRGISHEVEAGIDNLSDVGSDSSTLIVGASYFW